MAETKPEAEAVEAAAPEAKPAHKTAQGKSAANEVTVTTKVWVPPTTQPDGSHVHQVNKEALFRQAKVNTRDAIPAAPYGEPVAESLGAKPQTIDGVEGRAWEVRLTYKLREGFTPEPVDLDRVIKEAQAGYGDSHPGDPNFLGED